MEFNRINIEFKDITQNTTIYHMTADIVLLDCTNSDVNPTLYMLNKDKFSYDENDIEGINYQLQHLRPEAFVPLGEISEIDKKKKRIILKNQKTLSYLHLVTIKGNPLISYEFLAGIHTLVNALRIGKKIPSSLSQNEKNRTTHTLSQQKVHSSKKNKKIASKLMKSLLETSQQQSPAHRPKRLYEVQM